MVTLVSAVVSQNNWQYQRYHRGLPTWLVYVLSLRNTTKCFVDFPLLFNKKQANKKSNVLCKEEIFLGCLHITRNLVVTADMHFWSIKWYRVLKSGKLKPVMFEWYGVSLFRPKQSNFGLSGSHRRFLSLWRRSRCPVYFHKVVMKKSTPQRPCRSQLIWSLSMWGTEND